VRLTIDHVVPDTLGGSDDPTNLVTACSECNSGKSSMPADAALVADVTSDSIRWAAAMRQAAEEIAAADHAIESVLDAVEDAWKPRWMPTGWEASIVTFFKAGLDQQAIIYLLQISLSTPRISDRWAYFCGCCWKRIRQMQDRAAELLGARTDPAEPILTTQWTADELRELEADAIEHAKRHCPPGILDANVPCRHGYSPHCGDPACLVENAIALSSVVENFRSRAERDGAVMEEAEALFDG
jgi:hypothetical protein